VLQAQADSQAKQEEARDELLQAQADVRQAELEVRRNPLLAAIVARQNTLALEAAQDHLRQVQHDLANRKANTEAGVAIQEAARNKAKVQAETAKRNIESMSLKAHSEGYVAIQPNMSGGFFFFGMTLPMLQTGDTVRPGMAVAQIPDLKNWEISANIGELDRGHLAVGQKATLTVVALPGRTFQGHVKQIGNTTGPPWARRFETRVAIDNPAPDLRPGMTANVVITTEVVPRALWVPSQALFESDGRTFVYLRGATGFVPLDVKMLRRSETQVVLGGVAQGQTVALANPTQQMQTGSAAGGAMQAMPKK
jgi:multidrug resistance efflux pump